MKYTCQNCGWAFTQPAEIIKPLNQEGSVAIQVSGMLVISNTIKTFACPRCNSIAYEETEQNKAPANVYVYELTTGPQTKLDELLAEGYEVVNRYSKQYHLEKPKIAPSDAKPKDELGEIIQAGIDQAKAEAQA